MMCIYVYICSYQDIIDSAGNRIIGIFTSISCICYFAILYGFSMFYIFTNFVYHHLYTSFPLRLFIIYDLKISVVTLYFAIV